jgi:hypothetical protein
MPTSIHLDPATDRSLELVDKRCSMSKSALVRRAIEDLLAREELTPYERVADLVGSVSGGPQDLSERTGEKLRALLAERRK